MAYVVDQANVMYATLCDLTSNSSPVMVLTLYSPPIMEIWDTMDLEGGLGLVELP